MTFQPPPPPQGPSQGPPPQGPPPPQGQPQHQAGPPPGGPSGQWGPPAGAGGTGGSSFSNFDYKSVNQLDWGILGVGLLTLIFSFFSWFTYSEPHCGSVCVEYTQSAWSGFFGWFAVLLAVLGSAAVGLELFMPHVKLPVPARLLGLGLYALSALCVILSIFIIPDLTVLGFTVDSGNADTGHAFGFWVSLILILAGAVLSFMRFQQTGGQLPIGGQRPGGTAGATGQGYGPPA
jgi:hypothetical protein